MISRHSFAAIGEYFKVKAVLDSKFLVQKTLEQRCCKSTIYFIHINNSIHIFKDVAVVH